MVYPQPWEGAKYWPQIRPSKIPEKKFTQNKEICQTDSTKINHKNSDTSEHFPENLCEKHEIVSLVLDK